MPSADPDRFVDFGTPGAQEWWYFDAISEDGRDALVVVWYAGLPFDPQYGLGTLRHLKEPGRYRPPSALDHCAIGFSWYRDGETAAYALNAYRSHRFAQDRRPWSLQVAENILRRGEDGYLLKVDTPAVDGKRRIQAELNFRPVAGTEPLEWDLGRPGSPHLWMLAAADCRVDGRVGLEGSRPVSLDFRGRGYHDHNAGSEDLSRSMRRWRWGRWHSGELTHVYYRAEPRQGSARGLWITCNGGKVEAVREDANWEFRSGRRNGFGIRYHSQLGLAAPGTTLRLRHRRCVDSGPFYLRWLSEFRTSSGLDGSTQPSGPGLGFCELLDTRRLHHPLFNWMIPYRLKRPRD